MFKLHESDVTQVCMEECLSIMCG